MLLPVQRNSRGAAEVESVAVVTLQYCVYISPKLELVQLKKPLRQSTGIHRVDGINILYLS